MKFLGSDMLWMTSLGQSLPECHRDIPSSELVSTA